MNIHVHCTVMYKVYVLKCLIILFEVKDYGNKDLGGGRALIAFVIKAIILKHNHYIRNTYIVYIYQYLFFTNE